MTIGEAVRTMRQHAWAKDLPYRVYHVYPNLNLYTNKKPITWGPITRLPVDDTTFTDMNAEQVRNFMDLWIGMVT